MHIFSPQVSIMQAVPVPAMLAERNDCLGYASVLLVLLLHFVAHAPSEDLRPGQERLRILILVPNADCFSVQKSG